MEIFELTTLLMERGIYTQSLKLSPKALTRLNDDPQMLSLLLKHTKFLEYDAPLKVRLQCVLQEIVEQPKCVTCGNIVKMRLSGIYRNTFPTYCSSKCFSHIDEVKNKRIKTSLERYGTINPSINEDVQKKREQTNTKRYGVGNVGQRK